jgi:hypothetical protein
LGAAWQVTVKGSCDLLQSSEEKTKPCAVDLPAAIGRELNLQPSFVGRVIEECLRRDLRSPSKGGPSVKPLNEEFFDLFYETKRKFIGRLCEKAFTDLAEVPLYEWHHTSHKRIRVLRATAVMPSAAIRELARAIGCEETERFGVDLRSHWLAVNKVAREIGVEVQFLEICWKTQADLDAQWHAVREELLAVRAEMKRLGGKLAPKKQVNA